VRTVTVVTLLLEGSFVVQLAALRRIERKNARTHGRRDFFIIYAYDRFISYHRGNMLNLRRFAQDNRIPKG